MPRMFKTTPRDKKEVEGPFPLNFEALCRAVLSKVKVMWHAEL